MSLLQPVKRARRRSLWLQEALAREPEAESVEPLSGGHRTDVCIVGGGYTGLWTALQIKWLDPSVEVMLLEADICGGGASGRNGGFATSWWQKLGSLIEKYGEDEGMRLARESAAAVAAIGRVCSDYGIDADFRPGGVLNTATATAHIGDGMTRCGRRGSWHRRLHRAGSRGGGAPRGVAGAPGWHLGPEWGTNPASAPGARIAPDRYRPGSRYLGTNAGGRGSARPAAGDANPFGAVVAEKVVLATNAWLCALPEIRRAVLPMSSDMIGTAPIPERLAEIGWTGDECVGDGHMMVHYYRTTADGRIAFGKGGCSHAYLGRITQAFEDPGPRIARTERAFRRIYPALDDVPITHTWTGPIDRSETNSPFFGHLDRNPDILYG